MRIFALLLLFSAISLTPAADPKAGFVNSKISNRSIMLNQPVRVEFTTLPRQVEGIDIPATVLHALELSNVRPSWRVAGKPTVNEHEKTKTITVVFTLMPRRVAEISLPQIPLPWLSGDQIAEFPTVTVAPSVQIGTESRDLPKEVEAVSGYQWGMSLDVVKAQISSDKITTADGSVRARPTDNLELIFLGGQLAQAKIFAPGLELSQARDSFTNRWGMPQSETAGDKPEMVWMLGWTIITARPLAGAPGGTELHLIREDIMGGLQQKRVQSQIFAVLEGMDDAPKQTPKIDDAAIERDLNAPAIPAPEANPK
jgi:hypothetical protein